MEAAHRARGAETQRKLVEVWGALAARFACGLAATPPPAAPTPLRRPPGQPALTACQTISLSTQPSRTAGAPVNTVACCMARSEELQQMSGAALR